MLMLCADFCCPARVLRHRCQLRSLCLSKLAQILAPAAVTRAKEDDPVTGHVMLAVTRGEGFPTGPEWNQFGARNFELGLR